MSPSPKTLIYSRVGDLEIKIDVYVPETTGEAPIVLWYHGGGLTSGSRDDDLLPTWLLDASLARRWIFVSADYRLLVPCTGHDELDDIRALSSFLSSDVFRAALPAGLTPSGATLVSGGSAGSYMALQYALHASPKPKAVLNLFGMVDLLAPHQLLGRSGGIRFFGGFRASFPGLDSLLANATPCAESAVRAPSFTCADGRHHLTMHKTQNGLATDYLTGRPGFGRALAQLPTLDARVAALDDRDRVLFPLIRAHELPPTISVHGTEDSAVPLSDSEHLKKLLDEAGIKNELIPVPGAEHGLLTIDLKAEADGVPEAYARSLDFLESCL
ncbi:alpha/beta-hydrolase [Punctularia strigosozonata HHB-11173 SS5]|uniref:alpha/beta-hydrolase n=1 Tax=Punctularia strigosozonata (strain HHB-11173) TaxID=741275 RepID=UPI0004417F77|nr:alpha/beta-hydrolase [Punctularia strigosozonata HHB-11173 SS5]EIN13448.1 alpha/beta-hydrolase [Punctularia strigosozonata HHB-11173 SS5]